MSEISYQELENYTKGIIEQFAGIDEVIQELTEEQEKLQVESIELEGVITAEALKRKATVKKDLQAIKSALTEAQTERERIRASIDSDLNNQVNALRSKFSRQVDFTLEGNKQAIQDHFIEAEKVANAIIQAKRKGAANFNAKVITPINEIMRNPVGKKLSLVFETRDKHASDYLEELRKAGKVK